MGRKQTDENVSGPIDSALGARRCTDVVSAYELLGHVDERFHHESASPEHVGIPNGIPADVAVALPGVAFAAAQPGQEREVQPEVESAVSVSQSQVQKVLRLAVQNLAGVAVGRELGGLGRVRL